jgi:hypothetical protein
MAKLIAFGCSFTHGHSLPDQPEWRSILKNHEPSFLIPASKQYAWPAVLGAELNMPMDNRGHCGNSNRGILHDILTTTIDSNDLVVIMWTMWNRTTIFQSEDHSKNFDVHPTRGKVDPFTRLYYRYANDYELQFDTFHSIYTADCYLRSRGIRTIHTTMTVEQESLTPPSWFPKHIEFVKPFCRDHTIVDYAEDGAHPGVRSHDGWAKRMRNYIVSSKPTQVAQLG